MKKYILKYVLMGILAVPALTSCELDQTSPNNLQPGEGLTSIDDAESWRMGLYSTARSSFSGPSVFVSDIALDQFVATNSYGNYYGPTARWSFGNSDLDDQTDIWYYNYRLISRANALLANVPSIPVDDEDDYAEIRQIEGEAYLMRAIAYQRLAVFFCDRYEIGNAENQKGLPIVVKVDEKEKPIRQDLDSTYRFIQEDLDSARVRMNDNNMSRYYVHNPEIFTNQYMLTTPIIDMVEARIALAQGDYARAAQLADGIIYSGQFPLIDNAEELASMFTNDKGSEIMFQIFQNKDERGASWNDLGEYNASYSNAYGRQVYDVKYVPSAEILGSYDDTDIRYQAYFKQVYCIDNGSWATPVIFRKYPGNPSLKKSASDTYNTAKPFRVAEAYLIAAEAHYMLGETEEALNAFNALHSTARGGVEVDDLTDFEQTLADEYSREYMGEGLAFSAYKRLNRSVVRGTQQQSVANSFSKAISITPDNKRWTWEIPQQDLIANKNIEKNWAD